MALTVFLIYSVFIGLFVGALWKPIVGVLGYLAVYIIYNPDIWWGSNFQQYLPRPSLLAFLFLMAGAFLHVSKLNWSFSRREIELYLFLGSVWLSSLTFGLAMGDVNWMYLEKMSKLFMFIFFFIRIVNSLEDYKLIIWTFVLTAVFLSYQAHVVSPEYFYRGRLEFLGGIDFREANGLAAFLAAALIFFGVEMLRAPWWKKMIYVLGIALMLDTIIMTQSRAVFLGIVAAVPYVILRVPAVNRKQIITAILLGVVLFWVLVDGKFIERMRTISLGYTQEAQITRLDIWKASWSMFLNHPFGIGIKNFERFVPYYHTQLENVDAHNTYILCYSEIGIFGIALFLLIVVETLLQIRRIRLLAKGTLNDGQINLQAFALGAVLLTYLFGYMVTHSILYTEMLWILLSMPICLENTVRTLSETAMLPVPNQVLIRIENPEPPSLPVR